MCNEYNGHANFASWCVSLWIDDDEYLSAEIQGLAHEAYVRGDSVYMFSAELKDFISEMMPELNESSMVADLLGWAVDVVDFDELAENYYDEEKANDDTATKNDDEESEE